MENLLAVFFVRMWTRIRYKYHVAKFGKARKQLKLGTDILHPTFTSSAAS